uniref:Uncharacterized protein n=1 Tax=Lepeophtheirus salmonis TaxID=72036 RepID=A0A0K2URM1_LEPSM
MFLQLKRYDTDSSTLFRSGPEMTKYVKNILLKNNFCFLGHLSCNGILKLLKITILKYIYGLQDFAKTTVVKS